MCPAHAYYWPLKITWNSIPPLQPVNASLSLKAVSAYNKTDFSKWLCASPISKQSFNVGYLDKAKHHHDNSKPFRSSYLYYGTACVCIIGDIP